MEKTIILSRHKPTQEILLRKFPDAQIIEHLEEKEVEHYKECLFVGNAPLELIAKLLKSGNRFILVSIIADRGERGGDINVTPDRIRLLEVLSCELKEVM